MSLFHWATAGGAVGCVVFVQLAQNTKDNTEKGQYMFYHKSCGLLTGILVVPRLIARIASKTPAHLPGPTIQQWAGNASHLAMYGFITFLPMSGIAMGYFGGKGLPFFYA